VEVIDDLMVGCIFFTMALAIGIIVPINMSRFVNWHPNKGD